MIGRSVTYDLYLNENVRNHLQRIETSAIRVDNVMYKLQNTMRLFGVYAGGRELYRLGKDIVDTTAQFESLNNVIKFSSDGDAEFIKNKQFLAKTIKDLSLPIISTTEGYAKLSAAMIGTSMQGDKGREIFEGLSIAARVMHMDVASTGRAFLAVEQMVSKGKVMSEELRRQLGNAMPGALRLFANSLGMSQGELMDKMKLGEIISADAVPKFAKYLQETFSSGIERSVLSLQAKQEALNNSWLEAKNILGDELRPEIVELLENLTNAVHWITENRKEIIQWGKTILDITKLWIGYKVVMGSISIASSAYLLILKSFTTQEALATAATTRQTAAYGLQASSINAVTAAIERLNFVQNASGASFIAGSGGVMANTAANRYAMSAGGSSAGSAAMAGAGGATLASRASGLGSMAMRFATKVFIVGMAAELLQQFGVLGKRPDDTNLSIYDRLGFTEWARSQEAQYQGKTGGFHMADMFFFKGTKDKEDNLLKLQGEYLRQIEQFGEFVGMKFDNTGTLIPVGESTYRDVKKKRGTGIAGSIMQGIGSFDVLAEDSKSNRSRITGLDDINTPKTSSIRGNSVTTITIQMGDMIGMSSPTFSVKNMSDMKDIEEKVGVSLTKILTGVVNDSQIIQKK